MLSHVMLGTRDFKRAYPFYAAVLPKLGWSLKFVDDVRPWAGWKPADQDRPLFLLGTPHDGQPAVPGNGSMVAFLAGSREAVRAFHSTALVQGGTCEGPPGLRPEYHPDYYGAYVRDLDGHKLCACCHMLG